MTCKKTIVFLGVIFALLLNSAFAKQVDLLSAQKAGINFYWQQINLNQNVPFEQVKVIKSFTERVNNNPVYYIFNFSDKGFIVVSADDASTPVLAYSFDGTYSDENQPPQFVEWMKGYANQINYSVQHSLQADESVSSEWSQLLSDEPARLSPLKPMLEVSPLLLSTWDQGSPYNDLCPADPAGPGGKVWAGCVATAMSQVMYYYGWPQTGLGYHCYYPSGYPQQCADFGSTTYLWNEMLNSVSTHDTAVATLLWHAGVSVDMQYSPSGSGAFSEDAVAALINNFKYHPNSQLVYKDYYNENEWAALLRDNLDHMRPMYYHGFGSGGHAFNVDGYQGTNFFHFNWGWSGSYNGYFYLNNLNPGGSNFTQGQGAMINLYPDTINYSYPSYCSGQVILTRLKGTFEDGSGPVKNYQNNANGSWLISPVSSSDSIDYITIAFNRFNTETGYDVVNIYKGSSTSDSLVATLSGSNLPPSVVVYSNKALVTFTTNNSVTKPGWYASYAAHSMDFCKGTTTITDDQGTLSDGSFYFNYKNTTSCHWKIFPMNNGPVTFSFTYFKTEPSYDVVKIYDYGTEKLLGQYSGDYSSPGLPAPVTATSGKMFIMFTSNGTVNDQGWEGTFSTFPVGTHDMENLKDVQVYPNPAKDFIMISLFSNNKQMLKAELLSMDGHTILSETFQMNNGSNKMQVSVSNFSAGVYILRLTDDQESVIRKVVVEE